MIKLSLNESALALTSSCLPLFKKGTTANSLKRIKTENIVTHQGSNSRLFCYWSIHNVYSIKKIYYIADGLTTIDCIEKNGGYQFNWLLPYQCAIPSKVIIHNLYQISLATLCVMIKEFQQKVQDPEELSVLSWFKIFLALPESLGIPALM